MNIIVLLKQVPATDSNIEVADDGISIKKDSLNLVINPYDEIAIEEALRLKETHQGKVTVVSVGDESVKDAIKMAYAMGVDEGVLINDDKITSYNGLQTAKILSSFLKSTPFDIIIAGGRAVDDDNYFVGPALSELLNIPLLSFVLKEEIKDGKITCHKSIEGGIAICEANLPVIITCQRGLNEPRYTSLKGMMMAKKKKIDVKTLEDISLDKATFDKGETKIIEMRTPLERKAGEIIEGSSNEEKVEKLIEKLKEKSLI